MNVSSPLNLPAPVKRIARAVRDHPLSNRLITRALRAVLPTSAAGWAAQRAPALGPASARLPNGRTLRLHAERAEIIHSMIFYGDWTGDEPETLPLWFDLARDAATIVDVGAHIGHLTLVAALANPRAAIHAFEPHPAVRSILYHNIALNGVDNVTLHGEAVGREDGEAELFVISEYAPSSSSLSRPFMLHGREPGELSPIKVAVRRLDDMLPGKVAGPVLLKIDTETTEPDVIAGALRFIADNRPVILLEVLHGHDTAAAIAKLLPDYDGWLMTGDGLRKEDRLAAHPLWRNHLLMPKGKQLLQRRDA